MENQSYFIDSPVVDSFRDYPSSFEVILQSYKGFELNYRKKLFNSYRLSLQAAGAHVVSYGFKHSQRLLRPEKYLHKLQELKCKSRMNDTTFKSRSKYINRICSKSYSNDFYRVKQFCKLSFKVDISRKLIISILDKALKDCIFNGVKYSLDTLKILSTYLKRLACNHSSGNLNRFANCTIYKIPLCIKELKRVKQENRHKIVPYLRALITILSFYRDFVTDVLDLSLESITAPGVLNQEQFSDTNPIVIGGYFDKISAYYGGDEIIDDFNVSFKKALNYIFPQNRLQKRINDLRKFSGLHITGNGGPNNSNLLGTIKDHFAAKENFGHSGRSFEKITRQLNRFTSNKEVISFNTFKDTRINDQPLEVFDHSEVEPVMGKLTKFAEKGSKTRTVASTTSDVQDSLRPFHLVCKGITERLKPCAVYDQDGAFNDILEASKEFGFDPYSVDLSNATDTIDCPVVAEIIKWGFGDLPAINITEIFQSAKFSFTNDGTIELVSYAVGTPMGAFFSFDGLHLFNLCMGIAGLISAGFTIKQSLNYYKVLGDDMFFFRSRKSNEYNVAGEIYDYVLNLMGVRTSPLKGFTPSTLFFNLDIPNFTNLSRAGEFCGRIVCYGGFELTTPSFATIKNGLYDPNLFPSLLIELSRRGLKSSIFETEVLSTLCFNPISSFASVLSPLSPISYIREAWSKLDDDDLIINIKQYLYSDENIDDNEYSLIHYLDNKSFDTLYSYVSNLPSITKSDLSRLIKIEILESISSQTRESLKTIDIFKEISSSNDPNFDNLPQELSETLKDNGITIQGLIILIPKLAILLMEMLDRLTIAFDLLTSNETLDDISERLMSEFQHIYKLKVIINGGTFDNNNDRFKNESQFIPKFVKFLNLHLSKRNSQRIFLDPCENVSPKRVKTALDRIFSVTQSGIFSSMDQKNIFDKLSLQESNFVKYIMNQDFYTQYMSSDSQVSLQTPSIPEFDADDFYNRFLVQKGYYEKEGSDKGLYKPKSESKEPTQFIIEVDDLIKNGDFNDHLNNLSKISNYFKDLIDNNKSKGNMNNPETIPFVFKTKGPNNFTILKSSQKKVVKGIGVETSIFNSLRKFYEFKTSNSLSMISLSFTELKLGIQFKDIYKGIRKDYDQYDDNFIALLCAAD